MKEIRDKLKENEKELRKSVKEGSAFNTGKLLNIVANLIEYALNTHTHASSIASELEDLQCKNEINKSLESKKTYSIDEAFKTFDQVEIPEELKRYIHKTNIDLISMSIEKILSLNLKFDIESFCIQIIRTLNKEQKIVFNHIIEENKRNDLTKEAILNYIKFIDDIKTFCITNIIGIDQFNKNSEFCRGQLFAFKNILSMIKKQESEAKDGSKSK